MANFELKIDLSSLQARLADAGERMREAAKKELYLCADEVMSASKEVVPVDIGNLMGSGHVGKHAGSDMGVDEGSAYDDGDAVCIDLGYGGPAAPYALYVHEELQPSSGHSVNPNWSWAKAAQAGKAINWTRPGSGPKYLEAPYEARRPAIPPRILQAVKDALLNT
jgi:hypothetical protein